MVRARRLAEVDPPCGHARAAGSPFMKPPYVRGSLLSPRLRAACACAAFAALAALVLARFAAAAGIDLSWDDCGAAGAQLKTFACNTNSGSSFDLVGSFVPPSGINQLLGMSAEL